MKLNFECISYEGGYYHGILKFPKEYPFKPPSILMCTKNGRFKTNSRLCLSMSDFHPETWNPMWSVGSILSGLLSFMLDSTQTLGSIDMSEQQRKILAKKSLEENVKDKDFRTLFPEFVELYKTKKEQQTKNEIGGIIQSDRSVPSTRSLSSPQDETSYICVSIAVVIVALIAYLTLFAPTKQMQF